MILRPDTGARRRPRALAVAVLALLAGLTGATSATAQTAVGIYETSVAIETLRGEGTATSRVLIEAQEPGTVVISFDDVFPSEDLSWERVALGTTPYTLAGRVRAVPSSLRYDGDLVGTRHTFTVTLRADGLDDLPRAGFVTYEFVPDSADGETPGIGIRQGVAGRVRVGAWPSDLTSLPARIALSDLRLERDPDQVIGLIDRTLPDLPRIVNRGPATVRARTTNVGDVLVLTEMTLTLTRLPWSAALPFLDVPGTTVITSIDRPRLLLPGESMSSGVPTTASLDTGEVDRLPAFGLVRIGAESTSRLGATRSEESATATYLIAPWKEALVLALLSLAFRLVRRRRRRGRPTEAASERREPVRLAGWSG